jgi:integrase
MAPGAAGGEGGGALHLYGFSETGRAYDQQADLDGGAWKGVQRYSDEVGLLDVKPHDFRRFVGTQLAKTDIRKAQKALGHKRIDTTAAHYVLDELESNLTDDLYWSSHDHCKDVNVTVIPLLP